MCVSKSLIKLKVLFFNLTSMFIFSLVLVVSLEKANANCPWMFLYGIMNNDEKLINLLLDYKVDVNASLKDCGELPEIIEFNTAVHNLFLLPPGTQLYDRFIPIDPAYRYTSVIVDGLLNYGPKIKIRIPLPEDTTILHVAAYNNSRYNGRYIFERLRANGANDQAIDANGKTPIDVYCLNGYPNFLEYDIVIGCCHVEGIREYPPLSCLVNGRLECRVPNPPNSCWRLKNIN